MSSHTHSCVKCFFSPFLFFLIIVKHQHQSTSHATGRGFDTTRLVNYHNADVLQTVVCCHEVSLCLDCF
eukprot:m.337474 g.337474  ORF g.337474 m.337474 type:complete len:69 (+) comp16082_c0_seq9:455-661(+)